MSSLEVLELTKVFGSREEPHLAVDHVSFLVNRGETLGLVGESGCGKSTLAYCLARLIPPTSGSVRFGGHDWLRVEGKALRNLRRKIQLVFQDPFTSLNPTMRIERILSEPLTVHQIGNRKERAVRVREMLKVVGLEADHASRKPAEFSGGQRQRIAIARALMTHPEFLIADEPLSALDANTQERILDLLAGLRERYSLSMLFISHDLAAVQRVCDRVAIMHCGKLVEIANAKTIFQNPRHVYTRFLLDSASITDVSALPGHVPAYEQADLREVGPEHWAAV